MRICLPGARGPAILATGLVRIFPIIRLTRHRLAKDGLTSHLHVCDHVEAHLDLEAAGILRACSLGLSRVIMIIDEMAALN